LDLFFPSCLAVFCVPPSVFSFPVSPLAAGPLTLFSLFLPPFSPILLPLLFFPANPRSAPRPPVVHHLHTCAVFLAPSPQHSFGPELKNATVWSRPIFLDFCFLFLVLPPPLPPGLGTIIIVSRCFFPEPVPSPAPSNVFCYSFFFSFVSVLVPCTPAILFFWGLTFFLNSDLRSYHPAGAFTRFERLLTPSPHGRYCFLLGILFCGQSLCSPHNDLSHICFWHFFVFPVDLGRVKLSPLIFTPPPFNPDYLRTFLCPLVKTHGCRWVFLDFILVLPFPLFQILNILPVPSTQRPSCPSEETKRLVTPPPSIPFSLTPFSHEKPHCIVFECFLLHCSRTVIIVPSFFIQLFPSWVQNHACSFLVSSSGLL